MKLYYAKGTCSLAIHILLNELAIPVELMAVSLKTKQMADGEDYLKINPKGSVPALLLNDGVLLTENNVIQQYLADHYRAIDLLPPATDFNRYRILEWLNFISTELHKNCVPFINPLISEELRNSFFKPLLYKKLDYVDQHLINRHYLMGQNFTLPDIYLFVVLSWMPRLSFARQNWPQLERVFTLLEKRPSIQQALSYEGLI